MNIFMALEYYEPCSCNITLPAPGQECRRSEHPIKMIMPAWLVILSPLQNRCTVILSPAAALTTRSWRAARPPGEAIHHFIRRGSSVIKGSCKIMLMWGRGNIGPGGRKVRLVCKWCIWWLGSLCCSDLQQSNSTTLNGWLGRAVKMLE